MFIRILIFMEAYLLSQIIILRTSRRLVKTYLLVLIKDNGPKLKFLILSVRPININVKE